MPFWRIWMLCTCFVLCSMSCWFNFFYSAVVRHSSISGRCLSCCEVSSTVGYRPFCFVVFGGRLRGAAQQWATFGVCSGAFDSRSAVLSSAFDVCFHPCHLSVNGSLPKSPNLPDVPCVFSFACTGRPPLLLPLLLLRLLHARHPLTGACDNGATTSGRGDRSVDPTRHEEVQAPPDGEHEDDKMTMLIVGRSHTCIHESSAEMLLCFVLFFAAVLCFLLSAKVDCRMCTSMEKIRRNLSRVGVSLAPCGRRDFVASLAPRRLCC